MFTSKLYKPFQIYDFSFATNPEHPELLHFTSREDTFFVRAGDCARLVVIRNFFTDDMREEREYDIYCTLNFQLQGDPELNIAPFFKPNKYTSNDVELVPQCVCIECMSTNSEQLHEHIVAGEERIASIRQGSHADGRSFFEYPPVL